ncbi:hypothetical protein GGF32_005304 [Allomyces javanicus]|nr:hypothetical protein GGF32_005304 [Allomyces javanicus]
MAAPPPPPPPPSSRRAPTDNRTRRIVDWVRDVAPATPLLSQSAEHAPPVAGYGAIPDSAPHLLRPETTAVQIDVHGPADRHVAGAHGALPWEAVALLEPDLPEVGEEDLAGLTHVDGAHDAPEALAKVGFVKGVTIPTCEFMWSVLIFVRFGHIVGEAGLLVGLALLLLCAGTVAITATSVAAIATNGLPRDGVVQVMTRVLGSGIGGTITLIFGLGVAIFSSVEVVGSVQGLLEASGWQITNSVETDQRVLSVACLAFLGFVAFLGHKAVYRLALVFLVALIVAYSSLFAGFAMAPRVNDFGGLVTGWSWETLHSNLYPSPTLDTTELLSLLFPCFLGIFTGVNNASNLRDPHRAIPKGALWAIATSLTLYTGIFTCLAAVVQRPLLLKHFTVAPELAWPMPALSIVGLFLVGNGSALHCLVLASQTFCNLFAERVLPRPWWMPPFEQRSGTLALFFRKSVGSDAAHAPHGAGAGGPNGRLATPLHHDVAAVGEPRMALLGIIALALPFIFLNELEALAAIVAMCFLLSYAVTNISCVVLELLALPVWRPAYRGYHWLLSLLGALICVVLMMRIQPMAAFGLLCLTAVGTFGIQLASGSARQWGHAVHGLLYQLALDHLLAAEDEQMRVLKRNFCLDRAPGNEADDVRFTASQLIRDHVFNGNSPGGETTSVLSFAPSFSTASINSLLHFAHTYRDSPTGVEGGDDRDAAAAAAADACPTGICGPNGPGGLPPRPRNALWKPQIMAFFGMPHGRIQHPRLLALVAQLATRGGLCVLSHIVVPPLARRGPRRAPAERDPVESENEDEDVEYDEHGGDGDDEEGAAAGAHVRDEDDVGIVTGGGGRKVPLVRVPTGGSARRGSAEVPIEDRMDVVVAMCERQVSRRKLILYQLMLAEDLRGFVKVFVAPSIKIGQTVLLQSVGLGELTANTVLAAWPERGSKWGDNLSSVRELAHLWRLARICGHNMLIAKGASMFPRNDDAPMRGTLDVWWVVNEGPLMLLIAFLLKQHNIWRRCRLRLFAVCRQGEDPELLKAMLCAYLQLLRIRVDSIEIVPIAVAAVELDLEAALSAEMRQEEAASESEAAGTAHSARASASGGPPGTSVPTGDDSTLNVSLAPTGLYVRRRTRTATMTGDTAASSAASAQESTPPTIVVTPDMVLDEARLPGLTKPTPPSPGSAASPPVPFMRRAVAAALRAAMVERSVDADLVVLNLPAVARDMDVNLFGLRPGRRAGAYVELLEYLTSEPGMKRCILVHSSARTREELRMAASA